MTIAILNETFRGMADLKVVRKGVDGNPDLLMHWPTPQNFVLTDNKQQRMQYTRDALGNTVLGDTYIVGRDYTLNISYSVQNPELLAFKVGTYFEENTRDVYFQKTYTVRKAEYPAYVAGQFGFGIEADADALGSYLVNHVSTPLTQQPYATFTAATANSFAVGANGALKFSTNLVTANQTVSLRIPYTLTGLSIGETIVGEHSISAILVTKENEVAVFTAFSAKPDLSNGTIDPSAEGLEIPMFVKTPPGECLAYDIFYTGLKVQCN